MAAFAVVRMSVNSPNDGGASLSIPVGRSCRAGIE